MARMQRTNHWTGADRSGLTAADRDRLIAAFPSDTFCWVQRTIRSLVWRSGQWQWTHQFSQNLPKSPGTLLTPPSSFGSTPRAGLSGTS